MKKIFSEIASASKNYGADGDLKKTQYVLDLIGSISDPETYKCILAAGEQGMEMNCYAIEKLTPSQAEEMNSYEPCLRESDFIIRGSESIVSFINARGLGYSLEPKNAQLAAIQNYWVDVAKSDFYNAVKNLLDGVDNYQKDIFFFLEALDKQLRNNKYIVCDKYSFADISWIAYIHYLLINDYENLINSRKNISSWFERIKSRKSQCGQDIVAYDNLPNKQDIKNKKLASVTIPDF